MKRLAIVLPVVLLAACGGGSSGLSKADYLSKAEAVCADANTKIKALSAPTDPASFQTLVEKTVQIADDATRKIRDLDPPSKDKDDLEKKVIRPLEHQVAEGKTYLTQVREAVSKSDQAALGRLLQNPPTRQEADVDWMRSYGFKQCVEAAKTDR